MKKKKKCTKNEHKEIPSYTIRALEMLYLFNYGTTKNDSDKYHLWSMLSAEERVKILKKFTQSLKKVEEQT